MYPNDLDVPSFMNDPSRRTQQQEVINTSYGKVKNINKRKLQEKRKLRLKRNVIAVILAASLGATAISSFQLGAKAQEKNTTVNIPTGYILTEVVDQVHSGDTIYDIATEYYDATTYSGLYSDINAFTKAILQENNLSSSTVIHPGDQITIPVITSENNEYFLSIHQLENEISQIKKENYWVEYTVKLGDTYSSLAAKASGSQSQTYEILEEIKEKNSGNKDHFLRDGDTIWIVNPDLGPLRIALKDAEESFLSSVKDTGESQDTDVKTK